ncbi:MAG: caspase family protein, partial [Bacteroidota bacterium]
MSKPTFYAVFVGINAYTNCRQLDGCVNDVIAVSDYFQNLCTQPALDGSDQQINWEPRYFLLPHRDELDLLEQKGIHFEEPTRNAIVQSFDHFQLADPQKGDYCFFYYCGHGSFVDAPPIFSELAPDGNLQTLVCSDSRNEGQRDLLDKELAYLIARSLKGKTKTEQQKGIHFLSVFDSCHSGSITRSDDETKQRMEDPGAQVKDLHSILGFEPAGNELYYPFSGKDRIPKDGMKGLSYINLS